MIHNMIHNDTHKHQQDCFQYLLKILVVNVNVNRKMFNVAKIA